MVDQGIRKGQTYVDVLATFNNDLYQEIPDGIDPFYDDTKLSKFLEWVAENWNAKSNQ
jgi:hypothetical protein